MAGSHDNDAEVSFETCRETHELDYEDKRPYPAGTEKCPLVHLLTSQRDIEEYQEGQGNGEEGAKACVCLSSALVARNLQSDEIECKVAAVRMSMRSRRECRDSQEWLLRAWKTIAAVS